MPPNSAIGLRETWAQVRGLAFPVLIVTSILVIIAPLPPLLMDLLLACNITAAVLILLTTIYVSRPLEFSVFPAILLGTTLARLVLNVASTRLILTRGATEKTAAAGEVIEAFGEFVAGDKIAVGLILFAILVAIQFLVITKGSGRISEVAARFFLDGMPGKQMSIDADLAANVITQAEAKQRRQEISQQADFYGAMDGASKFVRGDAIAGIVITLINIAGGLYIGIVDNGMSFGEAGEVFTKLTIGDGLVTQIPGFLISLAAGLIVTRSSVESNLPKEVMNQMFRHPEAMFLSSAFLGAMAFTGMPMLPLLSLSGLCTVIGLNLQKHKTSAQQAAQMQSASELPENQPVPERKPEDRLPVEPLMVELGAGVVPLADPSRGGDMLERVMQIRHQIAEELGIILPKVRVRDNTWLGLNEYVIRIRDMEVARGEVWPTHMLAINRGGAEGDLPGIQTTEPLNNQPAFWIEHGLIDRAESQGFSVVEPTIVVILHLTEIIRQHAAELLTRQHVHELLGALKDRAPKLVEEVNPDQVKMSHVHQVLKNLLSERVPVRDLETILQTTIDNSDRISNLSIMTEYVRTALARTICQKFRDVKRRIHLVSLDPVLEDYLRSKMDFDQFGVGTKLTPQEAEAILAGLKIELKKLTDLGLQPVVITSAPQIRAGLRQMTSRAIPKLAVLCLNEITPETQIVSRGYVSAEVLRAVLMAQAEG
ncbi:MAG: flagellar biosynthesis protein FlhA [Planctomycetota bacterium]|nr:flagellar biosynthesis protein FlhA [Planctomycetota bacterium]MDA1162640.1 flagellar biosynthesis protein FlhA [Planctomycetota bacterium]